MESADYVLVGGGINGLVAGAMLGRRGLKVILLERNDRVGGCLRNRRIEFDGVTYLNPSSRIRAGKRGF